MGMCQTVYTKGKYMSKELSLLFINPSLRPNAKCKYPPVGLACILTALHKAGFSFDLIDMDAENLSEEEVSRLIRGKKYDLVGLGCIVTSLALVVRLMDMIRQELPESLIVVGNSVATSIPQLLLSHSEADIAFMGESDVTIVELVEALSQNKNWRSVPGIAWYENGHTFFSSKRKVVEDLDQLGFPDWRLFSIEKYNDVRSELDSTNKKHQIVFPLNSARGCIFNCTFCYHCFKNEKYRSYSENAIVAEVRRLTQEFGATFIYLWDELSFPTVKSFELRIERLAELPFVTEWEGVTRANLFSNKDIPLLCHAAECGLKYVGFSIENASPAILKAMNKKISHKKTLEHALSLWRAGITPLTSVIFGYPQETPESIKMTLDLCERCNIYPSVGYLQPLPGTPIYKEALARGLIVDEWEYLMNAGDRQDIHVNMTSMPPDELCACVTEGLSELARKLGLCLDDPIKTGGYQKPSRTIATEVAP